MSDVKYTFTDEVKIPASTAGRKKEPNPLLDYVTAANNSRGFAKQATITAPNSDQLDKTVAQFGRDLTRAGVELNVTVRRAIERDPKKNTATITFWVIDKIVKEKADQPEEKAETAK